MQKNEILVIYGKNIAQMAIKLAEEADLAGLIGDRKKRIGLKPNLVVSRPASGGATTHPEIAAGLILYLKKSSFENIVILEGSWAGDSTSRAFVQCGYAKLAKETGVKLIDTKKDSFRKIDCKGMEIEICESSLQIDFMINLPVLKGHCQTLVTCALKNNKGLISDREKRRFHSLGLHKPIAHLNTVARNDFMLVDGICGDPGFEEGGSPVYVGRLAAALDPVLCDAWAAQQLGYAVSRVPYIGLAEKLGIGVADPKKAVVRELRTDKESSADSRGEAACGISTNANTVSGNARAYARYIREDQACSACYAALASVILGMGETEISRLKEPVCIGQGFKGKKGSVGVGRCTSEFTHSCDGCPPTGDKMKEFLSSLVLYVSAALKHGLIKG